MTHTSTQPWHCLICGVQIVGRMQAVHHSRNYHMRADDPRRCDNVIAAKTATVANVTHTQIFNATVTEPVLNRNVSPGIAPADIVATVNLLTRRPAKGECNYRELPASSRTVHVNTDRTPLDYTRKQQIWERYVTPRATTVFVKIDTPVFKSSVTSVYKIVYTSVYNIVYTCVFIDLSHAFS